MATTFNSHSLYLRSSCLSWGSCIHPHLCPLWKPFPPGRWWGQRCTSGSRSLPRQLGSASSYAGSHYSAGPPGPDPGRLRLPGLYRLGPPPQDLLQGLNLHHDSQTGSEVQSGLWVKKRKCNVIFMHKLYCGLDFLNHTKTLMHVLYGP